MHQACNCFNERMFVNVFIGCVVVEFLEKKVKELKKTHESPMLRKSRLGENFMHKLLHIKNPAL